MTAIQDIGAWCEVRRLSRRQARRTKSKPSRAPGRFTRAQLDEMSGPEYADEMWQVRDTLSRGFRLLLAEYRSKAAQHAVVLRALENLASRQSAYLPDPRPKSTNPMVKIPSGRVARFLAQALLFEMRDAAANPDRYRNRGPGNSWL